jgi:predicted amidophosphoribosyltransferase
VTQGRWVYGFVPGEHGARREGIACPECAFSPFIGMQWACSPDGCGGKFDTFATRAHCPHCNAHLATTMCPACNKVSQHQAWYRRAG